MPSQAPQKTGDNTKPLVSLLPQWIASLQSADRSAHTIRSYQCAVEDFLAWYAAVEHRSLSTGDLTPIAFLGYRNQLQHELNLSISTVNTRIAALRAWSAWLFEAGLASEHAAARVKLIGRERPTASQGLKDTEVNALLREAQRTRHSSRDYAIVQLLLQTGLRIGECADLNVEDIVFEERSGWLTVRGGKGNKSRVVPLNGSVRKALASYVAPRFNVEDSLVAVSRVWPQRKASLSPSPLGWSQKRRRFSLSALRAMFSSLVHSCASRGLVPSETSAHTLRHTFASTYLSTFPGDLVGLATLLGHRSLDTTRIYSQPSMEQLASRVDLLKLNAYQE
jgi:site-specific recombinase XerD